MKKQNPILTGIKVMLPIIPGVLPFGLIMGTAAQNAGLSIFETTGMNFIVFAGAAQLVTVDLMTKNVESLVIVLTGCIINLRMMLYSASFAPLFKNSNFIVKTFASYLLTDQAYATSIGLDERYEKTSDKILFYFGTAAFMMMCWHVSVILGMFFGNFAPASLSLDFAVPLSFMALTIPTIKNRSYFIVAIISATLSVLLYELPYNLGLVIAAGVGVLTGAYLTGKKSNDEEVENAI
jgi:predicted branched-subunit amino acid permease